MGTALRTAVCDWGDWCPPNQPLFRYLESRPFPLYQPTPARHIADDCSATIALCFALGAAPDPMGLGYSGYGNTTTLEMRGTQIPVSEVQPGDVVLYGAPGATVHGALVVPGETAADPLTMTHGDPASPAFVGAYQGNPTGYPPRFFRFLSVGGPPSPTAKTQEGTVFADCPTGGEWVAGADGGIFAYDGAGYFGSLPGLKVTPVAPIVGIAATPSGKGYWLVGADGGVFCFGDAQYLGSLPEHPEWNAGGATDPAVGVVYYPGNGTPTGGLGYTIACHAANAVPALYRFPGNGVFAHDTLGAPLGTRDGVAEVDLIDGLEHAVRFDSRFATAA